MRFRHGWIALAPTVLLIACNSSPAIITATSRGEATRQPAAEIISCVDLPHDDPRSHNLSGLAWDGAEGLLYAISDRDKQISVFAPGPGFASYDFRPPIALDIDVHDWDGEALALAGDRFLLVANETQQAVFSVGRSGHDATQIALPWFGGTRNNWGFESLGYAESTEGRYVFAANEEALTGDGPASTASNGTLVRILRHPLDGGDDLEVAYLTEPIFVDGAQGENGVSDLAPLSPDRVLLLERAYVKGAGNAIRIYEVDLRAAPNIIALTDARASIPIAKRLVLDLALVPDGRCSAPLQSQRGRSLENYEGLAFGPKLDDGRRVLFMVSDDNSHANQAARVIAIALAPGTAP